jgi:uncharacterized membrane protein YdjX (TVP38/TMEM64 family)
MNVKKLFIPFVVAAVAVIFVGALFIQHQNNCLQCSVVQTFSPDVIRHFIGGFGPWAVIIYVLLYTVNTVSILPPIAFMSLSAGFLFGPVLGFIALSLGSFLGTSATFFISRYFGGEFVDRMTKGKAVEFQRNLGKNGFLVILPIRLIGFPPWELVNYVSGLSKIAYRDYISATMIGIMPAVIIQVFFSDRLSSFNLKDPTLYMAVGAFVLLAVVPAVIIKNKKK